MAELPVVGSDDGTWGTKVVNYLGVSHSADGTLNSTALGQAGKFVLSGATVFNTHLTSANTFQDLDLSATVGANGALCFFLVYTTALLSHYAMKTKGEGGVVVDYDASPGFGNMGCSWFVSDANSPSYGHLICATNVSGIIEHGCSGTSETIVLKLIGYIR